MEIQFAATSADRPTNAILSIRLDSNEELHMGDEITIQLLDRSFGSKEQNGASGRKCLPFQVESLVKLRLQT